MFSGRGKLLRIVLLFVALVILGVIQWVTQQRKRQEPLSGVVRVIVVPQAREVASCKDWRLDIYLENDTSYAIKLYGYTIHTDIGGEEEETAMRGELSTNSDKPIWELGPAKNTRIWYTDNGCAQWAARGNWRNEPTDIRYKAVAYTSDGIYSAIAGTKILISQ